MTKTEGERTERTEVKEENFGPEWLVRFNLESYDRRPIPQEINELRKEILRIKDDNDDEKDDEIEEIFFLTLPVASGEAAHCPYQEFNIDRLLELGEESRAEIWLANAQLANDCVSYGNAGDSRYQEALLKYRQSFGRVENRRDIPRVRAEEHVRTTEDLDEIVSTVYDPYLLEILIKVRRKTSLYDYLTNSPQHKWDELFDEKGRYKERYG